MLPSKFEANPTLRLRVKRFFFFISISVFVLERVFPRVRDNWFSRWPVGFPKYGHIYVVLYFIVWLRVITQFDWSVSGQYFPVLPVPIETLVIGSAYSDAEVMQ